MRIYVTWPGLNRQPKLSPETDWPRFWNIGRCKMRQMFPITGIAIGLLALALGVLFPPSLVNPHSVEFNLIGRFPIFTSNQIQVARVILAMIGIGMIVSAGAWIGNLNGVWRIRIHWSLVCD